MLWTSHCCFQYHKYRRPFSKIKTRFIWKWKSPWSHLTRVADSTWVLLPMYLGTTRHGTALTFLDTRVPTRWNPTVIPRGPCSKKGETGRIVRGRGWSIWTHAPGATRGSRSVITSASLSFCPPALPRVPLDLLRVRTRRTRVLSRAWGRERGGILAQRTRTWSLVEVHTNSERRGMGLHYVGVSTNTHARLRKRLRGADAMLKRGNRPRTPHAFARPPLLLYTRHTSA